jgi:alkanesulfonate monooxygenase SsuD/methylene tetrahydromethanopterin reductase-like flavin-dependent oxidoreductase (luciferase family)
MKRSWRNATLALVATLASTAADAQNAEVSPARCFIVANVFAKAGKEDQKPVAREAAIFYMARLSGSPAQVKAQLEAQLKTITNQNNGPIMQTCAQSMSARIQEIQAVQKEMAAAHKK